MTDTKILIIDDEESLRYTFENFLADEGYGVETAGNFEEALTKIAEGAYDLIFADIILGEMTGLDILRIVKERRLDCPVVMITGYPNIETASEAVRLGAFDYLPKPVREEELLRVTRMAFKQKALAAEKEKYRLHLEAIFRSVQDGIITVDEEMRIMEVNDAAAKVCHLLAAEARGRDFAALTMKCKGSCSELLAQTLQKRKTLEVYRLECQAHDQPVRVVTLRTAPLRLPEGTYAGAVLIIRDDTRLANLESDLQERQQYYRMIGESAKMQAIYTLLDNLANVQSTVLITGETGTGKELAAEAIHYGAGRDRRPLVKVNCSALPESLLESELFGHVKGAFTDAVKDKVGRFQKADNGTIFLDEIGDISLRMQLRLLRVLQSMEFERVGESTPIRVHVRVVAATNQDLKARVRAGEFREDLYFRLNVVQVNLPPLRERREDIPLLVGHFIKKFNGIFQKKIVAVSEDVQTLLMTYNWPGNIRELEHAIEHAFILCHQEVITLDHFPPDIRSLDRHPPLPRAAKDLSESQKIILALEKSGWNKAKAARLLGMSRQTIYRKIKELEIVVRGEEQ